jgi:DNA polymerase III alpha subunit (gram-positive type)
LSPLTKLFVGLLVVLSLLLTAGIVTFVNTVENQQQKASQAKLQYENQLAASQATQAQLQATATQAQDAERLAQNQIEQLKQQSNTSQKEIADLGVQLAQAKSDLAIRSADTTRLAEALKASEDTKSQLQAMTAALRKSNDQAIQQAAQSSQQISDLTNRLEVTERERRFATEQLEEMKGQNQKLGAALQDMGRNPSEILASATVGTGAGAPKINGVIREIRTIAGLPYATISVGSADNVTKGMEFNIVDRNSGNFLGKITIDTVELNESTGRISGPNDKLAQIKPGVEVKTQL